MARLVVLKNSALREVNHRELAVIWLLWLVQGNELAVIWLLWLVQGNELAVVMQANATPSTQLLFQTRKNPSLTA